MSQDTLQSVAVCLQNGQGARRFPARALTCIRTRLAHTKNVPKENQTYGVNHSIESHAASHSRQAWFYVSAAKEKYIKYSIHRINVFTGTANALITKTETRQGSARSYVSLHAHKSFQPFLTTFNDRILIIFSPLH